jgi:hypothetical protein
LAGFLSFWRVATTISIASALILNRSYLQIFSMQKGSKAISDFDSNLLTRFSVLPLEKFPASIRQRMD